MRLPHWYTPEIISARLYYEALIDERKALIDALAFVGLEDTPTACRAIMHATERLIEARTNYDYLRVIAK